MSARPQYVVFKMDDLATHWWREWKILTDLVKAENVKAGLGIWGASLLEGDAGYDAWIRDVVADGRFELWSHGFTGHGPNGEPGMEHQGTPYEYQKASFDGTRDAILTKCDVVLRTFSEHWHGGDATTLRVFNEDPYLRVWMAWGWAHREERIRDIVPDRRPANEVSVTMECADPDHWEPGYVNAAEFEKDWQQHSDAPFIFVQGHPWSWTDTSGKPDRTGAVLDRWMEFRKVIRFLRDRGAAFVNPYEYYRIARGHDRNPKPPSAPQALTASAAGGGGISLKWEAPREVGAGIDCYKIYRDGSPVALSAVPSWTGSGPAGSWHVVAVSKAEACSAPSSPAVLR